MSRILTILGNTFFPLLGMGQRVQPVVISCGTLFGFFIDYPPAALYTPQTATPHVTATTKLVK